MSKAEVLAVDWGTTNRRVYLLAADGTVLATERDDRGIVSVGRGGFAVEAAAIRSRFGDLPMLCAGMVGSVNGWAEAAYRPCPAGLEDLAGALSWVEPERTAIVPGVRFENDDRADVMRGEEVQLLGAVEAALAPGDALLCQPGTHCKWAELTHGRIARFTTAMTGELFALLRQHSLLAGQLGAEVILGDAFREGVAEGARRDLAASLFGIRAAKLLGVRDDADAASYASGLLIGADVAARLADDTHGDIHVLADPALGGLYAAAIEAHRRTAHIVDSHAAFVAGIISIGNQS